MKSTTLAALSFGQLTLTAILALTLGGWFTTVSGLVSFLFAIIALATKMREEREHQERICRGCAGSGFRLTEDFLIVACKCQHETKI